MSQRTVTVLVISQPEFSKKLLADMRKMIECFREKQVNIRVIYKLHPYEYGLDNTEFEMLNTNGQVEVIKDSAVNLYSLFQKADIQVGVTSTALFEGLAYSLETFLLHYEKTDAYMGDVCQMNYAKMCENGYEVAEEILSVIQHEDTREREEKQVFFQNNALERINEEISRIMVAGK